MRRITVFSSDGRWSFTPGVIDPGTTWTTALPAGNAAAVYGESLRGSALGYIIRILVPSSGTEGGHSFTLHTHVFQEAVASVPPGVAAPSADQ